MTLLNEKLRAKQNGRWASWEGMTWPIHVEPENDSVQWRLRYGNPTREDLLVAASFVAAYAALIECTQKKRDEVVRELRHLTRDWS